MSSISYALIAGFVSLPNAESLASPTLLATAILYCVVLCLLLTISLIDARTLEIPNLLNGALFACGVVAAFVAPEITLTSRFIGLVCVSVPLLLIGLAIPDSFGGGDMKLMAAAGFLLGWQNTLVAASIGVFIGGAYGVYLMVSGKKGAEEHFAFGPALCIGIATALLLGPQILDWYMGLQ